MHVRSSSPALSVVLIFLSFAQDRLLEPSVTARPNLEKGHTRTRARKAPSDTQRQGEAHIF